MKKITYMLTVLLLGVSVIAEEAGLSQLTLSIYTAGPDYYADGTAVQVGERYLVVYVNEGADFGGVKADGTLVDTEKNTVVTEATAVAGAKCGFKAIQYAPRMYPAGGRFLIVLLDTRDATGVVGGLVAKVGAGDARSAAAANSVALNSVGAETTTASGAPALVADAFSAFPPDTPRPVITAMRATSEGLALKLGNASDGVLYEVQTKTDLSSDEWSLVENGGKRLRLSAGATEIPTTLAVPQNDKVRFFRVIVSGSN